MRQMLALAAVIAATGSGAGQPADKAPPRTTLVGQDQQLSRVVLTPDGQTLVAVTGKERTLRLWDLATGKGSTWAKDAAGIAVTPDGREIAVSRTDGTVHFHELATGKELRSFRVKEKGGTGLVVSPDGKTLAA